MSFNLIDTTSPTRSPAPYNSSKRQASLNPLSRITSYNVCYTKLLRQFSYSWILVLRPLSAGLLLPGDSLLLALAGTGVGAGALTAHRQAHAMSRITSYNVCYTTLLRVVTARRLRPHGSRPGGGVSARSAGAQSPVPPAGVCCHPRSCFA